MRHSGMTTVENAAGTEGEGNRLPVSLHAVPAWARLTGSPLCAVEQAALCRPVFKSVNVILTQEGPLLKRVEQLGLDHVLISMEYRGLRSGGIGNFLRNFLPVMKSRITYVTGVVRLLRRSPGILHVHSRVLCGMYACLAGRLAGCRVVLSLHEPPSRGRIQLWLDACWIRFLPQEVIAVSAATAEEYRPFLKNKSIRVVHNCMTKLPVNMEYRRSGKPVVALIGLVARKRYDLFLEACRLLKQKGIEFEGWLIGAWETAEDCEKAKDFVARHQLGDVIIDKGLIQDMNRLYRAISVVAAPSDPVEALPMVIMEAMSYGLPVVATRVNGVPEMVESRKTGFLIDAGDVQSLADDVGRLLRDPELREKMGRAGRTRAEQLFSPERYRRDMHLIYQGMFKR